jgi:hypothetical protein
MTGPPTKRPMALRVNSHYRFEPVSLGTGDGHDKSGVETGGGDSRQNGPAPRPPRTHQ